MGIKVGIDLGTTFSAVAKINQATRKPEVIKNSYDLAVTPSVLCFQPDGTVLFGEDAKAQQGMGDTNAVAFFKRNMGNSNFEVEFFGKTYNATDLSAIFLKKIVQEAEESCGEKITDAVITVPAYFTHKERQATIDAGKKAGLNVLSIINEPTAAAFAYGLNEKSGEQTVLIYDLGGGTFDVTIAKINQDEIQILGSDGNHQLGGKDWDDCIARYLAEHFEEEYGVDLTGDEEMIATLLVAAENAKKQLTARNEVQVPIRYQNISANISITEEMFENISSHLLGETKDLTNHLIEEVGLSWSKITGAILVGGSTRMRMIHDFVKEMSGKEPLGGVNVDEAVALGAAIRANINIDDSKMTLRSVFKKQKPEEMMMIAGAKSVTDATAHALGMIAVNEAGNRYINSVIIKKNSPVPSKETRQYKFQTRSRDNELEVYVLQGSFERPLDNVILYKYVVTDIEPVKKNPSMIEISYEYTANGVVEVSAMQKENGKKLPIRIEEVPEDMSWTDGDPSEQQGFGMPEVDVILAIDTSGSMSGNPLKKAQEAMEHFVGEMDAEMVSIGLMVFADQKKEMCAPTRGYHELCSAIRRISIGDVGYCNDAEPFDFAARIFEKNVESSEAIRYLIVLTDGVWKNEFNAVQKAKKLHADGVEIMALGFGSANENFLRKIASTNEFASLTDLAGLSSSFSKIAQTIGESAGGKKLKMF